ncbi:MAG: type II secretion system protein, partial [Verrucomicrobiota bacterium]
MAQFNYKARKRSGEVVTGILEVADRGAALMQIERLGLFPIGVDMPKGAAAAAAAAGQKPGAASGSWT